MAKKGWLTPKLKYRIEILEADDDPNSAGGYDRDYTVLTTIWAELKEVAGFFGSPAYVRGEQTENLETHKFLIRMCAVQQLGVGFSTGFDGGHDSIADINPVKSSYFIRTIEGSDPQVKGRLFRIKKIRRDDEYKAYFEIRVTEIEEQGTGYPE